MRALFTGRAAGELVPLEPGITSDSFWFCLSMVLLSLLAMLLEMGVCEEGIGSLGLSVEICAVSVVGVGGEVVPELGDKES